MTAELLVGQNLSRQETDTTQPVLISINPPTFANQTVRTNDRVGGLLVDTKVRRVFDWGSIIIKWSRSISPSSQGSRQRREQVDAIARYIFNHKWRARLNFLFRQQELESNSALPVRALDVYETRGTLSHRFTKQIELSGYYRYRHQVRPASSAIAGSHRLGLELEFVGEPLDFFR